MIQDLISVIIPVHNIGAYLYDCVKSVEIALDCFAYEILLINNFSCDNSYEICKKLANHNRNIFVYNVDEMGVSYARNFGIKISKGKYIAFIDGDDLINRDYFKILMQQFNFGYDFVSCAHQEFYPSGKKNIVNDVMYIANNNLEVMKDFYVFHNMGWNVWGKIFLKKLMDNVKFDESLKNGEDMVFLYNICKKTNKYIHIGDYLYYYRMRSSSSSNINSLKGRFALLNFFDSLWPNEKNSDFLYFYFYYYMYILEFIVLHDRKNIYDKEVNNFLNNLLNKIDNNTLYKLPLKTRLEIMLARKSKSLFKRFVKIYSIYYFKKRRKEEK